MIDGRRMGGGSCEPLILKKRSKRGLNFSSCPWTTRVIRQSPANLPGRAAIYTDRHLRVKAEEKANFKRQNAKGKSEAEFFARCASSPLPFAMLCYLLVVAASLLRRA